MGEPTEHLSFSISVAIVGSFRGHFCPLNVSGGACCRKVAFSWVPQGMIFQPFFVGATKHMKCSVPTAELTRGGGPQRGKHRKPYCILPPIILCMTFVCL